MIYRLHFSDWRTIGHYLGALIIIIAIAMVLPLVVSVLLSETSASIDFLLTESGDVYCLEANTLPGMTPTSLLPQEAAVVGYSYEQLCDTIIRLSMEKTNG